MKKLTVINNEQMQPSNPIVMDRIYEALTMAKEGGVDSCMMIMISQNGEVMDCWANGKHPFVMLGALRALERDFMDSQIDKR